MKVPKRFALSTLLLLMLAVASVFGYAQWRRQWLIGEIDRLKSQGVEMAGLDDNWFWPRIEGDAAITFLTDGPTVYSHQGAALTPDQAKERFRNLAKQVQDIGVKEVWYCVTRNDANGGASSGFTDLDSLESETRKLYEWYQ